MLRTGYKTCQICNRNNIQMWNQTKKTLREMKFCLTFQVVLSISNSAQNISSFFWKYFMILLNLTYIFLIGLETFLLDLLIKATLIYSSFSLLSASHLKRDSFISCLNKEVCLDNWLTSVHINDWYGHIFLRNISKHHV